ncbi:hypothetical protein [Sphingomonas immobilis]|uniref:Lipoprotein n=1 Tax=Sphingomonas immobilis TaxID=3063997 RepID=A0ABT9A3F0_9SPHN|nr:hypothetical protein [Sphingomonas sp. CA1-15]MDO7843740.1 hypothetical protein [Sphingomonas sp. CA1-15]
MDSPDTRATRTAALFCLVASVIGGCARSEEKPTVDPDWRRAGWHYNFPADENRGGALYRFADNSDDFFIAMCGPLPSFGFHHHAAPASKTFTVEIDDHRWELPRSAGPDDNGLGIFEPSFADRFASAKRHIVYHIGSRSIAIPASPLIAKLVATCRARNPQRRSPTPPPPPPAPAAASAARQG